MSLQTTYTAHFIECVKKYPILYDPQHENFTNPEKRAEIWEAISREMNEASWELRTKWKSLKYGYRKYKDKNNEKPRDRNSQTVKWRWAPYMQFLDKYDIKRRRKSRWSIVSSSSSVPASSNSQPNLECQDTPTAQEDGSLLVEIAATSYTPISRTSSTRLPQVSSKVHESRNTAENAEDDRKEMLDFVRNKQNRPHTDAVDDLFQSYAKTFKKFSVQTQIMLKLKMAKLFADAELREHNMNRNQSPVHSIVSVDSDIKTEYSFDDHLGHDDSTGSNLSDA